MEQPKSETIQWLTELIAFLKQLLLPAIDPVKQQINSPAVTKLFTPEANRIWARAFISPSVDRDVNYDELEFLGDRAADYVFSKYIMSKYPGLGAGGYTHLKTYYMAKPYHAELAEKLGITKYIKTVNKQSEWKVKADVFEAIFGALDRVGDLVHPGLGPSYCINFMTVIFDRYPVDLKYAEVNPITQVGQIFSRQGLDKPHQDIRTTDTLVTVTISLTPEQMRFLENNGKRLQSNVIGKASAPTQDAANRTAYANALDKLKSIGVDEKWAAKIKQASDFADPEMAAYLPAARTKLRKKGLQDMVFEVLKTERNKHGSTLQLIGIGQNRSEVLGSIVYSGSPKAARLELLKTFATKA